MLLSHAHQFIYTKTVKTAGTSVEIYFEDACSPSGVRIDRGHHIDETITPMGVIGYRGSNPTGRVWYNHMPAKQICALVGEAVWNNYFKFCVIRNPFDKVVSFWWQIVNAKFAYPYKEEDFAQVRSDFSRWCVSHVSDATDRDKYLIDDKVSMDCFIRYESLADEVKRVCQRVGYPFEPDRLGRYKGDYRAVSRPFAEYYDKQSIAAVEAVFGWELTYFGYGRPSETGASP